MVPDSQVPAHLMFGEPGSIGCITLASDGGAAVRGGSDGVVMGRCGLFVSVAPRGVVVSKRRLLL